MLPSIDGFFDLATLSPHSVEQKILKGFEGSSPEVIASTAAM
jgi:hypothetical protein